MNFFFVLGGFIFGWVFLQVRRLKKSVKNPFCQEPALTEVTAPQSQSLRTIFFLFLPGVLCFCLRFGALQARRKISFSFSPFWEAPWWSSRPWVSWPCFRERAEYCFESTVMRGLLGTDTHGPTLESASPSPLRRDRFGIDSTLIWHRFPDLTLFRCQINPWGGEGEANSRVGPWGSVPNKPLTRALLRKRELTEVCGHTRWVLQKNSMRPL